MRTNKRKSPSNNKNPGDLKVNNILPLNENQKKVLKSNKNLVLSGFAGTGKTFLASYVGYKAISEGHFSKLVYVRSAVPTRNVGFLPGTEKEKLEVYESPYIDIATELFDRGDAYQILKLKGIVDFTSTSYIRGNNRRDSLLIVDECQNMSYHELDSIITRLNDNCRIIFCGDYRQADLRDNGLTDFYSVLRNMGEFDFIEFEKEDIVRSELVKNYIIKKDEILGMR